MGKVVIAALYGLFIVLMMAVIWAPSWFVLAKIVAFGAVFIVGVIFASVIAAVTTTIAIAKEFDNEHADSNI